MSGWNYYEGMSNNAVAAYEEGKMPISKWDKRTILEALDRCEEEYGSNFNLRKLAEKHTLP